MSKTDFFTELHKAMQGHCTRMVLTVSHDAILASVLPSGNDSLLPLTISGKPEDFDEGFMDQVTKAMSAIKTSGLKSDETEFLKQLEGNPKRTPKSEPKQEEEKPEPVKKTITIDDPTSEQIEKVKKLKAQKKSISFIAEKSGLTEDQVKETLGMKPMKPKTEPKQLDLVEEAEKAPEPQKVSHTPEDLAKFKQLITNKLHDAEDVIMLADRKRERSSDQSVKDQMLADINTNKSIEQNCRWQLEEIEKGTFGTRKDQTELIPVEELLQHINAKTPQAA